MTSPSDHPASRGAGRALALAGTAAASLLLHGVGWAAAARLTPRAARATAPVTVAFEVAPPPPAPARSTPPPPPQPVPVRRAVHAFRRPTPPAADLPPPPPPSEAPPPDAPAPRAAPRVGITLSSTATGGAFAVGTGNTLYGRATETAGDPAEAHPYAAVPAARRSVQPRLLERPEIAYPPEARRAGVQGRVGLLLRLDAEGHVVSARVLEDPGAGLGEAARTAALRFRFSPARLDGAAVETELRFTYTFVLE
ncbi:MAG: energy transducer TonB [Anaeromyxobacter sp.]